VVPEGSENADDVAGGNPGDGGMSLADWELTPGDGELNSGGRAFSPDGGGFTKPLSGSDVSGTGGGRFTNPEGDPLVAFPMDGALAAYGEAAAAALEGSDDGSSRTVLVRLQFRIPITLTHSKRTEAFLIGPSSCGQVPRHNYCGGSSAL